MAETALLARTVIRFAPRRLRYESASITDQVLCAGYVTAGLLVFPIPTFLPGQYWFWHSIWHLFMFQGYWCALPTLPESS